MEQKQQQLPSNENDKLPVSILVFCPGTIWLRPHIELIVRGKVKPWEAAHNGWWVSRRAGVPLHLLHACQVPWVKLGGEHDIAEASIHGSKHLPTLVSSGSYWNAGQQPEIDKWSQTNKTNTKVTSHHLVFWLNSSITARLNWFKCRGGNTIDSPEKLASTENVTLKQTRNIINQNKSVTNSLIQGYSFRLWV